MTKKRLSKQATDRICERAELINQANERQVVLSSVILSLIYGFTPNTPDGWEFYRELRVLVELLNEITNEAKGEIEVLDKVLEGDLF
ncbi:hypothetical protein ACP90_18930 [Labrenzia sp. CP4]|jgi:hypothetical protein|uniref:hypothetical protein n=1 Tax=unclassified Labrenzia TaxID=2648686 RepID=UPI0003B8D865|nr:MULTISPECIES: hypothetical protein [unclassified Labrenzia]AMN54155.1 hypothetical protein ACP90_18930 [Labrenzia sp. CP4]ERP98767.1 hypothetical protein Q669_00485 [Labrenzia sp. C1B10]ERS00963.1 hypothetical protein Q675_09155 [Labrenzia sp. C1B70]